MLLELLYEFCFLFAHLLGQVGLALVQLIIERLFYVLATTGTLDHEVLHTCSLGIQFFGDFTLEDFTEDASEFTDALVEQGKKLVSLKVQIGLQILH
jgi:hypothetical protein